MACGVYVPSAIVCGAEVFYWKLFATMIVALGVEREFFVGSSVEAL